MACGRLVALAAGEWWLEGMRVDPRCHGRGFSSQLHDHLVGLAPQPPDGATLDLARASGFPVRQFLGLSNTPLFEADALTAHALMFHDHEWEVKLLTEALRSEAFYVGALGSIRAQENRFQALLAAGLCKENVERLKAPIGLVPRLRDPHLLAISVVAEIAAEFQKQFGSF